MKHIFTFLVLMILGLNVFAQNKPNYPEPKEGFKRVDLILPKIENSKDYKVQIKFSFEMYVKECATADFIFNIKNLKEEYGIPMGYRFPYYVIENDAAEISEMMQSDCKSDKKVMRKIFSIQDLFIEYQGYYARPFYIPKSWNLEYRIWKADDKYITVDN